MRILSAAAGRIVIKDTSGSTRLDTDDGLFHTINQLSGTVAVGSLSGGNGRRVNSTQSTLLGTVNSNCTHVIGALKFTLNNYAAGMAYDRWTTFLGGSAMWVLDGEPGFRDALGDNSRFGATQIVFYSFRITSGQVFLDRRAFIARTPFTYTVRSHSIDYKLKTGLFT